MMGCGGRCDADRLLVPHYLQTLAHDMAIFLAGGTFLDEECATKHSPRWSGAACGVGRGRVREFVHPVKYERFVHFPSGCHMDLACTVR